MASLFKAALFVLLFFPAALGAERVRIAVSSKSLGFFDVWAGREGGFFRKHGLEAEIIAMRPPLTYRLGEDSPVLGHEPRVEPSPSRRERVSCPSSGSSTAPSSRKC